MTLHQFWKAMGLAPMILLSIADVGTDWLFVLLMFAGGWCDTEVVVDFGDQALTYIGAASAVLGTLLTIGLLIAAYIYIREDALVLESDLDDHLAANMATVQTRRRTADQNKQVQKELLKEARKADYERFNERRSYLKIALFILEDIPMLLVQTRVMFQIGLIHPVAIACFFTTCGRLMYWAFELVHWAVCCPWLPCNSTFETQRLLRDMKTRVFNTIVLCGVFIALIFLIIGLTFVNNQNQPSFEDSTVKCYNVDEE